MSLADLNSFPFFPSSISPCWFFHGCLDKHLAGEWESGYKLESFHGCPINEERAAWSEQSFEG